MIECMTIAAIAIVALAELVIHHRERRELYDRIMSGTLTDYNNAERGEVRKVRSPHEEAMKKWREGVSDK